jgi:isoquinoline 1-oxidoreductase alpha subunit
MTVNIIINGDTRELDVDGDMPLLWALRDHLGLTGTKYGCGVSRCGACTVDVDGKPRRACVTPVRSVTGARVTTIEGLSGPEADAVRASWQAIDVPQCGYCQSGQIMSVVALLKSEPNPSDEQIDTALEGNLCRCATYIRIRRAVRSAAESLA